MDMAVSLGVIGTIRHSEPQWMLTASAASKDGSTLWSAHVISDGCQCLCCQTPKDPSQSFFSRHKKWPDLMINCVLRSSNQCIAVPTFTWDLVVFDLVLYWVFKNLLSNIIYLLFRLEDQKTEGLVADFQKMIVFPNLA